MHVFPNPVTMNNRTRGHAYKLVKQRSHLDMQKYFLQIELSINGIPSHVVEADSLSLFKLRLDSHWNATGYGQLQRPSAIPTDVHIIYMAHARDRKST